MRAHQTDDSDDTFYNNMADELATGAIIKMRYVVLDTETTGLDPDDGHKIIEIGCIEILNRNVTSNTFHKYINPNREIDIEASKIHGLTYSNLKDKPLFEEIFEEFSDYISDSPIIIHNAPFDIGFLKKSIQSYLMIMNF